MPDGGYSDRQSEGIKVTKIAANTEADAFFFTPGRDAGLSLLSGPEPGLSYRDPALIRGFAVSDYASVTEEIEKVIRFARNMKFARQVVEIPAPIIVLEDAHFQESFRGVGGKWVLSSASGTRLRNKHALQNPADGPDHRANVIKYLLDARPGCHLPIYDGPALPSDVPFVIECRNKFNFFHFLTETLGHLCAALKAPTHGPIYIHYPSGKDAAFPDHFISAVFPELAHRVEFRDTPGSYPVALGVFEMDHYIFQAEHEPQPSIDTVMPEGWIGALRTPSAQAQAILTSNAVRQPLEDLRLKAYNRLQGKDFSYLPKRFWVARSTSGARQRQMKNEAKLVRQLEKLGFETVYFENLTPLEQVAIMAQAEMMISYHGAGFANMVFAGPDAHVIEIGHIQTALMRWSDFIPLAHTAGCKYTSFFADLYCDTPEDFGEVRHKDLLPVALGDDGIDQIVAFISNALGEKRRRRADADVKRLAIRLNDTQEFEGLRSLLEDNLDLVENDATLLVHMANCAREDGDDDTMEVYLERAWDLEPTRPAVLERLIKVARRRKDWPRARALLAIHKDHFPDRDTDFTGKPLNRPD